MMISINNKDQNTIQKLLSDGVVYKFVPGEIVCLEHEAFYNYRKRVFAPSKQLSYWVNDKSITIVE